MPQRDDIGRIDDARDRRRDPKRLEPGSACFAVRPRRVAAYPKPSPPITGFTPPIPGRFIAWQQAFWGAHYARLKQIKRRYDPEGLFFVHHSVGSEDGSADGFERVT